MKVGTIRLETMLSLKTCHKKLLELEFFSKCIASLNSSKHKKTATQANVSRWQQGTSQVKSTQIKTCDCSPSCLMNNSFDIKTVEVKRLCLNSNQISYLLTCYDASVARILLNLP